MEAPRREVILLSPFTLRFAPYLTGTVMRLIKTMGAEIVEQGFAQGESLLECRIRQGQLGILRSAAAAIYGLTCIVEEQDA